MRHWTSIFIIVIGLALGGCASTIETEVTAFHEWPAGLQDKSYVFEQTREQANDLEYRNYQNLLRGELQRLGFIESRNIQLAKLKVGMQYQVDSRDVRVVYPEVVDPWYGPGFYGPYGPYYPYWYAPPVVVQRESNYLLFTRQLKIGITRIADGKKLFDVTVNSQGTNGSLAAVMPYMVRSAFSDFPGQSGVPRRIELRMDDRQATGTNVGQPSY